MAAAEAWKDASDRDRNVLAYGFQSQAAMGAVLDGNQAVGSAMSQALANNSVTPSSERLDALAQGTPEALWPLTEGKGELASQAMRSLARTEGGLSQAAERYDKLSPDARQALAEASLKNLDSETGQKLVETIARGDDMGAKSLLFKDYRNPQVLENDHLRGVLRDEALKTLETGKTNPATYWATNSVQSYSKTPEEARDSYNRLRAMAGQADKPQLAEKYNKMADDVARWTSRPDPRKFDSPLMFRQGERAYLIGRRTLHNDGEYDLGEGIDVHWDQAGTFLLVDTEASLPRL